MAKPRRPSLEAFAQSGEAIEHEATATIPTPLPASKAVELVQQNTPAPVPTPVKPRRDREHTSLYLSKKVIKTIKEIGLQYDRKPHDLYLEGINLMLAQYGKPSIGELSEK